MRYRALLAGESGPRCRLLTVTVLLLAAFSVGFVAGGNGLGILVVLCGVAVAVCAGIARGGLLVAQAAVFSAVVWWAAFPPLVGYLRWDDAARYRSIRRADIYLGPEGELAWGMEAGLGYGILAAFVLGSVAYGVGALYRSLRRDDPNTHPYAE